MTLIGKISIVAIFVMSLVFMTFSLMVYATHTNWRELVTNTTPAPGKPMGLRQQLADAEQEKRELEQLRLETEQRLAMERAARTNAIATLETLQNQRQMALQKVNEDYNTLVAQHRQAIEATQLAQNNLKRLKDEVEGLRESIRATQQDRDTQFAAVVRLTDEITQLEGIEENLRATNEQLAVDLAAASRVLRRHQLSKDMPLHNVPPVLEGEVTAVGTEDLVEVSLGSDDGLRIGHELEIYRPGGAYLGRVRIMDVKSDKAVAKIQFREGIIRIGDKFKTRVG